MVSRGQVKQAGLLVGLGLRLAAVAHRNIVACFDRGGDGNANQVGLNFIGAVGFYIYGQLPTLF